MDLEIIEEGIALAEGTGPRMVCCWWIVYPIFF